MDAVLRELIEVVGAQHVLTDADAVASYTVDWTGRFRGHTPAVVRPGSVDEVAAIVEIARRNGVALVPQGGNTGLVGGSVPLDGEIVVSSNRLAHLDAVDAESALVWAGAGATIAAVQGVARAAGLRYAVDLAARDSATVGGTIATNAGGLNVVRYGNTGEQVVRVEAAMGNGSQGGSERLTLIGSEGTFGIVTAATLRLVPAHDQRVVAIIGFASVAAAVDAARTIRAELPELEAAELFLDDGLRLVCRTFDLDVPLADPWRAYLLIEVAADEDPLDGVAAVVDRVAGAQDAAVASDAAGRAALWRYREDHTLAINTLGPPHKLDVSVPLDALAGFIEEVPARVAAVAPDARTWLFGHVAVGNIHVNVTGVAPDDEQIEEAVLTYVVSLGGSISAEHGIGTAKKRWLHLSHSEADLAGMRALKHALDPDGILNPNVLLPA
ncbi:MAG: hypothetical protein QOE63_122 [Acidimicrobiaceae bacterium]|jgi:FAD/FMN-containing dehydrogenase